MAHSKILVTQWRNEHAFRSRLGHHLVFTKSALEPIFSASRLTLLILGLQSCRVGSHSLQ
jgi:hypothetical protein